MSLRSSQYVQNKCQHMKLLENTVLLEFLHILLDFTLLSSNQQSTFSLPKHSYWENNHHNVDLLWSLIHLANLVWFLIHLRPVYACTGWYPSLLRFFLPSKHFASQMWNSHQISTINLQWDFSFCIEFLFLVMSNWTHLLDPTKERAWLGSELIIYNWKLCNMENGE